MAHMKGIDGKKIVIGRKPVNGHRFGLGDGRGFIDRVTLGEESNQSRTIISVTRHYLLNPMIGSSPADSNTGDLAMLPRNIGNLAVLPKLDSARPAASHL